MNPSDIILRAPELRDLDYLYLLENDPQVWRVSWCEAPVSRQMLWEYITSYSADIYRDRQLRLVIEYNKKPVGTVDLTDFDPRNSRALLGIAVDKIFQRQGIATGALTQAIDYCSQALNLHQVAALVPQDNVSSIHLFQKLGFRSTGCLKSWLRRGSQFIDVVVFQKMLG